MASERSRLLNILFQQGDKDFVRRILLPNQYPSLDNKDGSYSTHSMSWGESDDGAFVYPTVVNVGGKLKRLSQKKAMDYAKETGEFIKFDNPDEADWFSRNYKKVWEK